MESKPSDLDTPSHLDQSRPNLKVWTPTRLNLMALGPGMRENTAEFLLQYLLYLGLKEDSKYQLMGEPVKTMTVEELRALPLVRQKLAQAQEPLPVYGQELQERYGQLRLHSHAVVGIGLERFIWESWEGVL